MNHQTNGPMNRRERADLVQLCRQREKLAKVAADARASEMKANFDQKLAAVFAYDSDAVWQKAQQIAKAAHEEANKIIAARSKELGIPAEFAPSLDLYWSPRGQNGSRERRKELRVAADSRIEALLKDAKLQIEAASVDIRTRLIADSLESADARSFLESMPTAAALMPHGFTVSEIQGMLKIRHYIEA
jgi:hypothetical protein